MEISSSPSAATPGLWLAHSRPADVRACMREGVADKAVVDGVGRLRITPLEGVVGARVFGLDAVPPLTSGQRQALCEAMGRHGVLLAYGRRLDEAGLAALACRVRDARPREGSPAPLLYVGAAQRAGGDAVWLQLAAACEMLGAGTLGHVGDVELTTYNAYLHRLRLRTPDAVCGVPHRG